MQLLTVLYHTPCKNINEKAILSYARTWLDSGTAPVISIFTAKGFNQQTAQESVRNFGSTGCGIMHRMSQVTVAATKNDFSKL